MTELPGAQIRRVEEDVRALMRQVAEARTEADSDRKQQVDAQRRLLLGVVDVLDAFERVFRNIQSRDGDLSPQMKVWVGNFRSVRRLVDRLAREYGVVRIENLDRGFDPAWHTIVETVQDASRPDGTIVSEVQPGYLWREQVLRKAEVIAVRNGE